MDKPSNMQKCINTKEWNEGNVLLFEWRLDLVYKYKIYFDPAANFSREQMDFINGLMHPEKMGAIACRYHQVITDAIKFAEAADRRIRAQRLAVAMAKRPARG